jgi:hypothetical protein
MPQWARLDLHACYTFDRDDGKPRAIGFNVEKVQSPAAVERLHGRKERYRDFP